MPHSGVDILKIECECLKTYTNIDSYCRPGFLLNYRDQCFNILTNNVLRSRNYKLWHKLTEKSTNPLMVDMSQCSNTEEFERIFYFK